jgi:hypothetical protein
MRMSRSKGKKKLNEAMLGYTVPLTQQLLVSLVPNVRSAVARLRASYPPSAANSNSINNWLVYE